MAKYYISTTAVTTESKEFENDEDAWNYLSKEMDLAYKTGRNVIAYLYRIRRVTEIMTPSNHDWSIGIPVCVGSISRDYNGKPWNNPCYCYLCNKPLQPERAKWFTFCEQCEFDDHKV
jgi:hypothetical protein